MNQTIDITNVTLHTKRLTLRPWRLEDVNDFYEYAKVDGVGQMAGWIPHKNIEDTQQILDLFIQEKKTFAIEYQGKVIGSLGIEYYDEAKFPEFAQAKGRELGFVLAKDDWGKGFMPEAVEAVIHWLFIEKDLDFIVCGHFNENERSKRVQEKCGFVHQQQTTFHTNDGIVKKGWLSILKREDYLKTMRDVR